jgi:hypothetical protein
MLEYNNRALSDEFRTPIASVLGIERYAPGKMHFVFSVENRSVAYTYIRKNGCSAFKNLITNYTNQTPYFDKLGNPIEFLEQTHKVRDLVRLERCNHRLFVYRCPLDRMLSLFVNKVVCQIGDDNLLTNINTITGRDPNAITFTEFVTRYLAANKHQRAFDPHVWSQTSHLYPIKYTDAIPLAHLEEGMSHVVGSKISNIFFGKKTNASAGTFDLTVSDLASVPVAKLHQNWRKHGIRPASPQLMSSEIRECLRSIYWQDVQLITKLDHQRRRCGEGKTSLK